MIGRIRPYKERPARRNPAPNRPGMGAMAALFLVIFAARSSAAIIEINPSNADADCNEEFENTANALQPGDELILHGGTYSQSCRRAITVNGTEAQPVVIRAAEGESPLLTRPANNIDTQNNIEIVNSSYLIIRGLQFQGGNAGVRFIGGHHITIEDCEIFETGNNAIPMNNGDSDAFIIRRNHIHHTGLSSGGTEGEGMYIGCHTGSCRATNILVEGNYIHHLRGTSSGGNDGIEVKVGSYGNIIRNNVIHDTNIGRQYPCIFVYGGGQDVNIVEGNVVWNCGEAIYAVSDTIIRNNIVLNSDSGISSYPHNVVSEMGNMTIVNNTIFGNGECFFLRWSGANNMVLANNAAYCEGNTAVNVSGLSGSSTTIRSNYVAGTMSGANIDNTGFFSGGNASSAFVDASKRDFWTRSGSILVGNADANFVPALDFNEISRMSPYDVGAYETEGLSSNPGWTIVPGFKDIGGDPNTLPAAPTDLRIE